MIQAFRKVATFNCKNNQRLSATLYGVCSVVTLIVSGTQCYGQALKCRKITHILTHSTYYKKLTIVQITGLLESDTEKRGTSCFKTEATSTLR